MLPIRKRAERVGALAALCLPVVFHASAQAIQLVDARDGVAVEALMSLKEPTRIRIENAPIKDVFGSIYSSNCTAPTSQPATGAQVQGITTPSVNPSGEVAIECDQDKGEIYIRPVGTSSKPVNLFVSSAQATYTLVLRRADVPADTIVIRDPAAQARLRNATSQTPGSASANHVRTMKSLLVAMASDRVPSDIQVTELNRPIRLWAEASFSLMRRYEGRSLVGEKYLLQNISQEAMVLAEQEFDQDDEAAAQSAGQIVGVAVENHNLLPGQSTNVFILRRLVDREARR